MFGQVLEQVDILQIVAVAVYCEVLVTVMEGGTTLQSRERKISVLNTRTKSLENLLTLELEMSRRSNETCTCIELK